MPNDSFSRDVHKRSYDVTRDDVTETLPPQFGKQRFEPRGWGSSSASPPPTFQSRMQQNSRYEVTRGGETYHRQTENQRLGQRREVSSFNLVFFYTNCLDWYICFIQCVYLSCKNKYFRESKTVKNATIGDERREDKKDD